MHTRCVLSRRQIEAFTFSLPAATNRTRPYRVVIQLRTIDGTAQLGLSTPSARGPTDLVPNVIGTIVYSTEVTTEQYIAVPWSFIQASGGGSYIITLSRARARLVYTIEVSTPYADTRLAEPDATSLAALQASCCPDTLTDLDSPFCTRVLPAALAADHVDSDDLCQIPPNMCDGEGRLTQLSLAQAGLVCPAGVPLSLSGLESLNTLDLAFNSLNSTLDRVAQMMSTLPSLENAFLRYAELRGQLNCDLLATASNLQRLTLSGNMELVGELPGCFLQSPSLQELYLSKTGLSGLLPDVVPRNSSLKALYAIGPFDQERTDPTNPGFIGRVPRSLLASPGLQYLNLANNELSGGLSSLPPNLKLLNLSANALDGALPTRLPVSLSVLDLSLNKLTGSLPSDLSGVSGLTLLDVSGNRLIGAMMEVLPPNILVLDVSLNQLAGALPSPLPQSMTYLGATGVGLSGGLPDVVPESNMRQLLLAGNAFEGPLPLSMINGSAPELVHLDLSSNQLTGPLDSTFTPPAASEGRRMLRKLLRRLLQQPQQGPPAAADPASQAADSTVTSDTRPAQVSPQELNMTAQQRQQQQQRQGAQQQQQQQGGNSAGEFNITGPWQSMQNLAYVDLSNNQFTGPVPPSMARMVDLRYLALQGNQLSGSLAPYADALADVQGFTSLLVLDLGDNKLSGPVPEGLAAAPILDPNFIALRGGRPVLRVLNLANNSFSGPFPQFLVTQPPQVEAACSGCQVRVTLNGTDNKLQCPSDLAVTPEQQPFLERSRFACTNSAGQQVSLLAAAGAAPAAAPAGSAVPQTRSSNAPTTAPSRSEGVDFVSNEDSSGQVTQVYWPARSGSSAPRLNSGQIAGIVIGAIAGAVLLASIIAAAALRYKRHRSGWRKDDLNGGAPGVQGPLDDAFGLTPASSAAAEAGVGYNGSALQYLHSPYSSSVMGPGTIEMQNSGGRNGLGRPLPTV